MRKIIVSLILIFSILFGNNIFAGNQEKSIKVKLIKQLAVSKHKIKKNKKFEKYLNKFEIIIPKLSVEKLKRIKEKLDSFDLTNKKYDKYKNILLYLNAKVDLELLNRLYKSKNKKLEKTVKCSNYDCIINAIKNNKNVEGLIFISYNPYIFPSFHGANKIYISFNDDVIDYSNVVVYNNVSEKDALNSFYEYVKNNSKKIIQKKDVTKDNLLKDLSLSIDYINRVGGNGRKCKIDISDKNKLIDTLNNWKNGGDANIIGDCNNFYDFSFKKIKNIYKDELIKNEKNKAYKDLEQLDVKFIGFKDKYNVGENVNGEIEVIGLPKEKYFAYIDNDGYDYKYDGKDKILINRSDGWVGSYYDTVGKKVIEVNIYKKGNGQIPLKTFKYIINVVDDKSKKYINGIEVDPSYILIEGNLYKKNNKVYTFDDGKFVEIEGLEPGEFKLFDDFIYTKDNLYFRWFSKYTKKEFKSDYNTFKHIYGKYYQDKDFIYSINAFYKTVNKINKGTIKEVKGCFGEFIIIDNVLYKNGNGFGDGCEIPNEYKNLEFKQIG